MDTVSLLGAGGNISVGTIIGAFVGEPDDSPAIGLAAGVQAAKTMPAVNSKIIKTFRIFMYFSFNLRLCAASF
jgi:hypothetical protein